MARIKLGLARLNAMQLILKAQNIVATMTGNPTFATPSPTLAEVQDAIDELAQAAQEAESGSHFKVSVRNSKQVDLENLLRDLAAYIQNLSKGDALTILSSGFEIVQRGNPVGPLGAPQDANSEATGVPGEGKVMWKPVKHARGYIVEMTTGDPAQPGVAWTVIGYPTESKLITAGLTPGQVYWFRVKAWGTSGIGAPSDPTDMMAT